MSKRKDWFPKDATVSKTINALTDEKAPMYVRLIARTRLEQTCMNEGFNLYTLLREANSN